MQTVTYAVDVGRIVRVANGNRAGAENKFGWARISSVAEPKQDEDYGYDADSLKLRLSRDLAGGRRATLGIEAPLFIPYRRDQQELAVARGAFEAKISRAFTAGAGASVLTYGLIQLPYLLEEFRGLVTTLVREFGSDKPLLVWEAFVSGVHRDDSAHACFFPAGEEPHHHGKSHICDAWSVGDAAHRSLQLDPTPWRGTCEPTVLSVEAFADGWSEGVDLVEVACGRVGLRAREGWDFRIVQRCKPHSIEAVDSD